jgi:uncharacterized protein (DUF2141 family)
MHRTAHGAPLIFCPRRNLINKTMNAITTPVPGSPAVSSVSAQPVYRKLAASLLFGLTLAFGGAASAQTLSLEAESLTRTTNGATATNDNDSAASGGVRVTLNSSATGNWVEFTLPNIPAGTYTLQLAYKTNANRGQATFLLDGAAFSSSLDQYAASASYPSVTLGTATFASAGNHTLRMTVAGKNSSSSSYTLSADKFTLVGSTQTVAAPSFSPGGGTYTSAQSVTLTTATSGASIRYTTDGSTPSSTSGAVYSGPIGISATTTLNAIAYTSSASSSVSSATYTINPSTQPVSWEAESLTRSTSGATASNDTDAAASGGVRVTLNSTATGNWVQFTLPNVPAGTYTVDLAYKTNGNRGQASFQIDGSSFGSTLDQYASSASYPTTTVGTITLASTGNHTLRLTVAGKNSASSSYTLSADKITLTPSTGGGGQVATPVFSPAPGSYSSTQSVTITTATSGASIRYTTDGSTPSSTTGTLYTGPVSIAATSTLKAIAYKSGLSDSAVASGTYTIGGGGTNYTPAQILAGVQAHMTSSVQVNTKPHINTMTRAQNVNVYQVSTGVFAYASGMAIDTDGSDPDPDPDHQGQTTWQDDNGKSLGAHHVPYYVLGDYCYDKTKPCPHFYYAEHNITGLQFALIFYNGKCIGAVFGDTQGDSVTPTSDNDSRELGEASVESAALLGIPSSGTTGGVDNGVTVVIFSGSQWVVHGTNSTLKDNAQALVQKALNQLGNAWGL